MIVSSITTPSWKQKAVNAEIRLYPDDLRSIKSNKTANIIPKLNPDVLQEALQRFKAAYFVGFSNVAGAIQGAVSKKSEPTIIGKSARNLQYRTTVQLGTMLSEEKEELVHLKAGHCLIPIAHVQWQNSNIEPHYDWVLNTVKSLGYMPNQSGVKNSGQLSFWNIKDSEYANDPTPLLGNGNYGLSEYGMTMVNGFTPKNQDPNERPFFVFIDGSKVLFHSISGIEIDEGGLRLIQVVELRLCEEEGPNPFPKTREGSVAEQIIAERDEFIAGNEYDVK